MPKIIQISPEKIAEVKQLCKTHGAKYAASKACISYYAALCIKNGKPLMVEKPKKEEKEIPVIIDFDNRCPITGFWITRTKKII